MGAVSSPRRADRARLCPEREALPDDIAVAYNKVLEDAGH